MTLKASLLPSAYEGEIECLVKWLSPTAEEALPHSGEVSAIAEEYLYLRVKKKPVLVFVTYYLIWIEKHG